VTVNAVPRVELLRAVIVPPYRSHGVDWFVF
jgi:hypothetical protein